MKFLDEIDYLWMDCRTEEQYNFYLKLGISEVDHEREKVLVDVSSLRSIEEEYCTGCKEKTTHNILSYPKSNGVIYKKGCCEKCLFSRDLPKNNPDPVIYFGKHKGKKISQVPRDYLHWMIKNVDLNYSMKERIKEILK